MKGPFAARSPSAALPRAVHTPSPFAALFDEGGTIAGGGNAAGCAPSGTLGADASGAGTLRGARGAPVFEASTGLDAPARAAARAGGACSGTGPVAAWGPLGAFGVAHAETSSTPEIAAVRRRP
jgi:hypothetical protein